MDPPIVIDQQDDRAGQPPLLCIACRSEDFQFDVSRSFARYEDSLVRAIVLLKFEEMDPLADWFAQRLAEVVRQYATELQADLVVPVPLHRVRRQERGLTKRVAKHLGLPHQGVLLVRKRPRPDKHLLTSQERWEAVRGAFATRPGSQVDNRRVLLVDDVMTTGATLDACAKALREAGARSVLGLTVARAILNPQKVSR
jgi:ComF family protein